VFDTRDSHGWRAGLNERQRAAVEHRGGPLLVIAGAGSGKTKTLSCRVAHLIERGVPPARILLLTFTRRAAQEMLSRAGRLTAARAAGRVVGGTFHSVAHRPLRSYGPSIGLSRAFTILDQADAADLMNLIRSDLELGARGKRFPRKDTLATIYSRTVNSSTKLTAVLSRDFPWCVGDLDGIRAVFEAYGRRKRQHNVVDYDDLLLLWIALLHTTPVGAEVAGSFDHILVDEYQDTNGIQAEILRGMAQSCSNIMVVGDDAQAIDSFRSASVHNMLDFPKVFSGSDVVVLEQNYRSTQPILDVSNAVIAGARRRHDKSLWCTKAGGTKPVLFTCLDEAQQSDAVCNQVLEDRERGVTLKQQAVLFRTGHHSAHLEIELTKRNIPFVKFGGLRFVEAAHIKDVIALLRILDNPSDELAWFRILQLLEGIGPATASRLLTDLDSRIKAAMQGPGSLRRLVVDPPEVPPVARRAFSALAEAFLDCAAEPLSVSPAAQIDRLRPWLEGVFERIYDNAAGRLADVVQLERIAAGYSSRGRFISDLALDPPLSTSDLAGPPLKDDDYLTLTTIHSAKGREWDIVHVIHAADGMLPSDMATGEENGIEEERRLLYVALTRARDMLHVYWCQRHYHRRMGLDDAHGYAQISRFLPPPVASLFEQRSVVVPEHEAVAAPSASAARSLQERLNGLWA
jgi:DNA helicase II / ATP-dependent DNA helicase PcrA